MRTPSIIQTTVLGVAAALALSVTSQAAESSTPVIGYYKQSVPPGVSALVGGLTMKKDFQGKSTAVAAAGANSAISCVHTGTFTASYVELLDDPTTVPVEAYAGTVLDVVSNNGASITVMGDITALGQALNFCVRKHVTLGTLLPAGSGADDFDSITLSNDVAGVGVESSYYYEGGNWKDANLLPPNDVVNGVVIYPGQGFAYSAGDVRVLTFGGGASSYVKSGKTIVPVFASGPNLVGPVNPLVGLPPGSPTGTNSWLVVALAPFMADFDSVDLLAADGSGTPSSYYFEGGHVKDANLLPPNDVVDTLASPVGSSVILSVGGDGTVSFAPVTVSN